MKKLFQWKKGNKGKNTERRKSLASLDEKDNVGYLIDLKHIDGSFTRLHHFCWIGDEEKVRKHLKRCDVNIQDNENRTPIHLVAAKGHKNILMILLENGAKVNIRDDQGRTPLMKVVECGHIDLIALLLGCGANVDICDNNGDTAIHIALSNEQNAICMILLQHHAGVNRKNKKGETALHIACAKKQLDIVKVLLHKGAAIDAVDGKLQTPLILACKTDSVSLVSLLIQQGADCSLKDCTGHTSVDYAHMSGILEIIELFNENVKEEINSETNIEEHETVESFENKQDEINSWSDSEKLIEPSEKLAKVTNLIQIYNEEITEEKKNENVQTDVKDIKEVTETIELNEKKEKDKEIQNFSVQEEHTFLIPPTYNKVLKKENEDLFADLGFSDSDESNFTESSENQQNKKMPETDEVKSNKLTEENECVPSVKSFTGTENGDFKHKSNSDQFEKESPVKSYIPSVIDKKSTQEQGSLMNQFKRPPLIKEKAISLHDIEEQSFFTAVHSISEKDSKNAISNSSCNKSDEEKNSSLKSSNTKCNVNQSFSESDWDSENSDNSCEDDQFIENKTTDECIHINKDSNMIQEEVGKNVVNVNTVCNSQDVVEEENDLSISKNSENAALEGQKYSSSDRSEHWSTLGKFGTMQGTDEIWENNAQIIPVKNGEDGVKQHETSTMMSDIENNLEDEVYKQDEFVINENSLNNEDFINVASELNKSNLNDEIMHEEGKSPTQNVEEKSASQNEQELSDVVVEKSILKGVNNDEKICSLNTSVENLKESHTFDDINSHIFQINDSIKKLDKLSSLIPSINKECKISNSYNEEILSEIKNTENNTNEIAFLNLDSDIVQLHDNIENEMSDAEITLSTPSFSLSEDDKKETDQNKQKIPDKICYIKNEMTKLSISISHIEESDKSIKMEEKNFSDHSINMASLPLSEDCGKETDQNKQKISDKVSDIKNQMTKSTISILYADGMNKNPEKNYQKFSIHSINTDGQNDIEKTVSYPLIKEENQLYMTDKVNFETDTNDKVELIGECNINEVSSVRSNDIDTDIKIPKSSIVNEETITFDTKEESKTPVIVSVTNDAKCFADVFLDDEIASTTNENNELTFSDDGVKLHHSVNSFVGAEYNNRKDTNETEENSEHQTGIFDQSPSQQDNKSESSIEKTNDNSFHIPTKTDIPDNVETSSSTNKYLDWEIKSDILPYLNFSADKIKNSHHLKVKNRNKTSKLTFRRLSADQLVGNVLDKSSNHLQRNSFTEMNMLKDFNISKPLLRQDYSKDDSFSEKKEMISNFPKNISKFPKNRSSDNEILKNDISISKYLNRSKTVGGNKMKQYLFLRPKQCHNDRKYRRSLDERDLGQTSLQLSSGNLLTGGWESWYAGANRKQLRRLSTSVISSKTSDYLEQISEKPEHRRLSLHTHKNPYDRYIHYGIHSLDKFEKESTITVSDKVDTDVNRKQFRIALTRSLSLHTFPNNENFLSSDNNFKHCKNSKSKSVLGAEWSTSCSDSVFEEVEQNENVENDKLKQVKLKKNDTKKSQKVKNKHLVERSKPRVILTSWESDDGEDTANKNNMLPDFSSSSHNNKVLMHAESNLKKPYAPLEATNIDNDSSTTITDTDDDRRHDKGNDASVEDQDDTLSISTDDELFLEEVEKNERFHSHAISPSQLATLQASLREQRLSVDKKSQKVKSLMVQLKTMQQEKLQLHEKVETMLSNNCDLKTTILEMKNHLTDLQYSLEEEKQNKENAEALLNTMKNRLAYKDELFISENSIRKSLETELQSLKEANKTANVTIKTLQEEINKLQNQLEQERNLQLKYEEEKSLLQKAEKSTNTDMDADEKVKEGNKIEEYNIQLKVENEVLKQQIRRLEDDLNDKVACLSEKLELVQNEKDKIEDELQTLDMELQKKQLELEKSLEMHSFILKSVESEKDELQRKLKAETEKRITFEKESVEISQKLKRINAEYQKCKNTIEVLETAISSSRSSKESRNLLDLEKLKIENQDLKNHLNEVTELYEHTRSIIHQEKEETNNALLATNMELQGTKIKLANETEKLLDLQKTMKEREHIYFEKDSQLRKLEKENCFLIQQTEELQQKMSRQQSEIVSLNLEIKEMSIKSPNKEPSEREEKMHQHIHLLNSEKSKLEYQLSKENENIMLNEKLSLYIEREEMLNERVHVLQVQKRQLEEELQKEKEHSDMLDSKLNTFNQNLMKMEMLIVSLQTAKEELETKISVNNNAHGLEQTYFGISPADHNLLAQLTEQLKQVEQAKEETEVLLQKERKKSHKVMRIKKSSDIQIEQEKYRIQQLMDINTKLKAELAISNNRIKGLENLSNGIEQRFGGEEWRIKVQDLNKQIEQLQQKTESEQNLRQEAESKCSLLQTELNSLRIVQTTLIEELLNELRSVKSQNQEQKAEANNSESCYTGIETKSHEEIYHALRDISLQLKQHHSTNDSLAKNDFTKTKNKLMGELSQLQASITSKGQEFDTLEQERNRYLKKYKDENHNQESLFESLPVKDIEIPVKLSNETRIPKVSSFSNYHIPSMRWSHISPQSSPLRNKGSSDTPTSQSSRIPVRENLQFLKDRSSTSEEEISNKLPPEFQVKLDNAITKHLNSGPKIDISIPVHHTKDDATAKKYMSSLKQKYFV